MRKIWILILVVIANFVTFAYADNGTSIELITNSLQTLVRDYETRINALQIENTQLKNENESLKRQFGVSFTGTTQSITGTTHTGVILPITSTPPATIKSTTGALSNNPLFIAFIDAINAQSGVIFAEQNFTETGVSIGLFEFIEPNACFISIDDGKNPEGIKPFKRKVLYRFDANLNKQVVGVFDLDYTTQKYITLVGSNPYVKADRIRIKNPSYKGKLLEDSLVTSVPNKITSSGAIITTTKTFTGEVTIQQIQNSYMVNHFVEALQLANEYLIKNPNAIDVLKIKYRSLYILNRYDESLKEIANIETIQGASFDKTIACDGKIIAKISKKTDLVTHYTPLCAK